jgi:REP element-mobilizing transposase RayT
LEQLRQSLEVFNVTLLSYALMPNHFHLLVTTPEGNLSEFMQHFNLSYTAAFNRKHRRRGHLYKGRYKAFLIDADNYLLEVSRHIHLNPVRMKSEANLNERWSDLLKSELTSLPGYLHQKRRKSFWDYGFVLGYMGGDTNQGRSRYKTFVEQGIKQDLDNPLKLGIGSGIVGSEEFITELKQMLGIQGEPAREQPETRQLHRAFTADELIDRFSKVVAVEKEALLARGRQSIERAMLMELLYRYCRLTQPEIGKIVGGIAYSAVSQSRKRLRERLNRDATLKKKYQSIEERIAEKSRSKT